MDQQQILTIDIPVYGSHEKVIDLHSPAHLEIFGQRQRDRMDQVIFEDLNDLISAVRDLELGIISAHTFTAALASAGLTSVKRRSEKATRKGGVLESAKSSWAA